MTVNDDTPGTKYKNSANRRWHKRTSATETKFTDEPYLDQDNEA